MKTITIVAVRINKKNTFFEFPNKKNAQVFINALPKDTEWAKTLPLF